MRCYNYPQNKASGSLKHVENIFLKIASRFVDFEEKVIVDIVFFHFNHINILIIRLQAESVCVITETQRNIQKPI